MNILYINHYAGSLIHGMEYRPYYLAREWVRQGHTVTVIASNYSHLRQKNVEIDENSNFVDENIDGINYIWCKTPHYPTNGIKRLINIFVFLKRVYTIKARIIKQIQPNLVIASSTYPYDTVIAKQIAKQALAKMVYEVHDLWPLTPIEVGGMSKWHPFILSMQWAENYGYKNADKVVSLLPKAKDYMLNHGMHEGKFVYIANGVAIDDCLKTKRKMPNEHQIILSRLKDIEGRFILAYAGGMGESNALEYLIAAAKLIQDKPLAIVLVGEGANKAKLQLQSAELRNVYFLPAISKLQIPDFLAACDALYIGWHNLAIYRFGICPNKLFDYMLAKKPIIHSVTAGNDLVSEANCGISVAAEDVNAIAAAIDNMTTMPKAVRMQLAENAYNFVLKNHDYTVLAQRFLTAVNA